MDSLDDGLSSKMRTLEKDIEEQIKKALKNPLAGMRK